MSSKSFAIVEAIDNPKGAMLVRYQVIERCEPDPEEKRLAEATLKEKLGWVRQEDLEEFQKQIAAAEALYQSQRPVPQVSYNVEDKNVICTSPEEVVSAIREAKEAYDEMAKLKKTGALRHVTPMLFR